MIQSLQKNLKILALVGLISSNISFSGNFDHFIQGLEYGAGSTIAGLIVKDLYDSAKENWTGDDNIREIDETQQVIDFKKRSLTQEENDLKRHEEDADDHECTPEACEFHKQKLLTKSILQTQIEKDSIKLSQLRLKYCVDSDTKFTYREEIEAAEKNTGLTTKEEVYEQAHKSARALLIAGHPLTSPESE